ncbi:MULTISPECIES: alpha/beta hydrolase [unclassified Pseudomonas]|uniref:alpha/beta hydrolase n=1 Tax=unclassified Pseudomonas TaxID=196821 RepID=UPI001199B8C0|nr:MULTISPECIES: alpha/beta hydrolase [unclassified Pseudomonas]TWC22919.1 acetyl esterase [Pseudomonas sp. SJZ075]TWC24817.1 acetyl esterase [Pseudomonas sp. SJZ074]TWC38201.1 acetyl esterase [Pseudomonas sp. SJZ078]TWC40966.1 acetyl esterase [Pseudomonas sp. SJZ085]TWC58791.1 acetyl esterase [Pseudomonas sp. SJZ124]
MNLLQTLKAKLLRALAKRMKAKFIYDAARYPLRSVNEQYIPTTWGAARALFYWPDVASGEPLPVYLNLHGGGFVAGVPEHDDSYCRRLAHNLGCLVVNLDYVLAPEHPFPAGLRQSFEVLEWLAGQGAALGIDPQRIAVGGHSAGGNLAAGLASLARGHKRLRVVHQVIDYAALDLSQAPELKLSSLDKPLLRPGLMHFFNSCYLSDPAQARDPLVSPLLAPVEALRGLPAATLITAEYDILRAEGQAYGEKLRQAGVAVNERVFPGCDHMFTHLGPDASADEAWQFIEDALRRAFEGVVEEVDGAMVRSR